MTPVDGSFEAVAFGGRIIRTGAGNADSRRWAAPYGNRSLDHVGLGTGGIVQRLARFTGGLVPEGFTDRLTAENTLGTMRYQPHGHDVIAGPENRNIGFAGLASGSFGAVPDTVSVRLVPEATTWALLITGLASVGVLARGRRAQRPVIAA